MKKFITIALAVAVLFSFAACQQTPITGEVRYFVATQSATYVEKEKATADGFTYVGYTNLGTEVAIPASEVEIVSINGSSSGLLAATDSNTVVFKYRNVESTKNDVEAKKVTGIVSVDTSDLPTLYAYAGNDADSVVLRGESSRKIDLSLVSATVAYEGGQKDVALNDTLVSLTSVDFEKPGDVTLKVVYETGVIEEEFKITIAKNLITNVALTKTDNYAAYYANTTSTGILEYAENVGTASESDGLYVELTYQSTEVVYAPEANLSWVIDGDSSKTSLSGYAVGNAKKGEIPVQAKYTGGYVAENLTRTASTTVRQIA